MRRLYILRWLSSMFDAYVDMTLEGKVEEGSWVQPLLQNQNEQINNKLDFQFNEMLKFQRQNSNEFEDVVQQAQVRLRR